MTPTIHNHGKPSSSTNSGNRPSGGGTRREEPKKPDLNCRIKYYNTLPDVPFEPKFLAYPFDPMRFVQYKPTSLERSHKWELLTEPDLGVHIDLVNPDAYAVSMAPHLVSLDPVDEQLLEDEPVNTPDTKRSKQHGRAVSWMRKTEYISSEFNRFGTQTERKETKLGYNIIKKQLSEDPLYKDRDSQLRAIEKTFDDVKVEVQEHYSKPGVVAIQESPLFPDFDLWKYPFAQVIFDADPAPTAVSSEMQTEQMSQALIRGMMDESGEQFVAYFLPTEETLRQRQSDVDEGVPYVPEHQYDYKLAREYNWTVKNKASKGYEENYFFVFKSDGVFYNELETRVRLSRRRAKDGFQKNPNSRLLVLHRDQNEQEEAAQNSRLVQLQTIQEEDETAAVTAEAEEMEVTGETEEQNEDVERMDEGNDEPTVASGDETMNGDGDGANESDDDHVSEQSAAEVAGNTSPEDSDEVQSDDS